MMMLATEVLVAHHNLLRRLLAEVAERSGQREIARPDRGRLIQRINELTDELTMHEMIEDSIFYPAMNNTSSLVPLAHAEHRQIADQLAAVLRTPIDDERFVPQISALRTSVEHHAGEEEQQMFPEVEQKVPATDLERIGRQLTSMLDRLRASRLTRLRLRLKRQLIRHTPSWG